MFNKGWRNDELPINAIDGSWVSCRNALLSKGFESIMNEKGLIPSFQLSKSFIGVIPIPTGAVIFSTDNTKSEIGIYNNGSYTPIINTSYFGFRTDKPIEGVFQYDYLGNLIVAWTDNFNNIRLLNLNSLPFALNGTLELVIPNQSILADLTPEFIQPIYSLDQEFDGGGSFPEGVLYLSIAYKIDEYNITRNSILSNPIYIFNSRTRVPAIDGNPLAPATGLPTYGNPSSVSGSQFPANNTVDPATGGTDYVKATLYNNDSIDIDLDSYQSDDLSKSYKVTITNLDTRYKGFRVFLILKNKNGVTAYLDNDYLITGSSKSIILTQLGNKADLNNIIIPSIPIKTCKTMTNFENKLVIANISTADSLSDFQKYANNIKVDWDIQRLKDYNTDNKSKNHFYNDSTVTFKLKTFCPFDVYGFNIHLVLKDGSVSEGFHIPGRDARSGERDLLAAISDATNNEKEIFNDNNTRFQIRDTSDNTVLGFWENADEVYPNLPTSEIWDSTGLIDNLSGQKVRHHRMPTHKTIYSRVGGTRPLVEYIVVLNFSQIYIPSSIKSQIQGFFISYNARTANNRLIEGESTTLEWDYIVDDQNTEPSTNFPRNGYNYRFYDANLIHNKPSINPAYIKITANQNNYAPSNLVMEDFIDNNSFDDDKDSCIKIIKASYLPADNYGALDQPNNASSTRWQRSVTGNGGSDECVLLHLSTTYSNDTANVRLRECAKYIEPVCQLVNNITTLYFPYTNQSTVIMSDFIPIGVSNNYTINNQANGDIFISRQFFVTVYPWWYNIAGDIHKGIIPTCHQASVYSVVNYGFIYSPNNVAYPLVDDYYMGFIRTFSTLSESYQIKEIANSGGGNSVVDTYTIQPTKLATYFSSVNNLINYGNFNPLNIKNNKDPYLIAVSNVQQTESSTIGWRTFLVNNYHEMQRNRGEIWKLSTYQRMLLIHQKYSLFYAPLKDVLSSASVGSESTYLGVGDIFDRDPFETLTTDGGTCGCQSQFATFVCEFGYFSIDLQQGYIYLFDGKLTRISDLGLTDRFKELLLSIDQTTDNPYQSKGVTASYDSENKRIIITLNTNNDSYSISYNCVGKIWAGSRHDYAPSYIFYNRLGLFSVTNSDKKLYIHNVGLPGVFYGGITYPLEIDIVYNEKTSGNQIVESKSDNKLVASIFWQTTSQNILKSNNVKDTFTTICVYTNTQSTGIINIKEKSPVWFEGNSRELDEGWLYNDLRDIVKDRTLWVHDNFGNLNLANLINTLAWFKKSKIISKFIIIKASYDNTSGRNFYINNLIPLDRLIPNRL